MEQIRYIGDGVYAVWDGFGLELRTGSHDHPENVVYLEPSVLESLNNFYKQIMGEN